MYLHQNKALADIKGISHLWKDECVFKMGHLCRRNVKLLWIWSFLVWEKTENVFLVYVNERQQLPECTCFAARVATFSEAK